MTIQPSTIPAPCFRCVGADIAGTGPIDGLCWACRGEVARNREDARDELVRTVYTGHGLGHTYRPDVSFPGGAA
jgi:hypothetical protein